MQRAWRAGVTLVMVIATIGCGDETSTGGSTECPEGQVRCDGPCIDAIAPTLTAIQERIFDQSCTSFTACHVGSAPAAEMDLSSIEISAASLIDVESTQVEGKLRVAPGESSESYIINKVTGVDLAPGTLRMPISVRVEVLCEAKIDAMREWIDQGAPID